MLLYALPSLFLSPAKMKIDFLSTDKQMLRSDWSSLACLPHDLQAFVFVVDSFLVSRQADESNSNVAIRPQTHRSCWWTTDLCTLAKLKRTCLFRINGIVSNHWGYLIILLLCFLYHHIYLYLYWYLLRDVLESDRPRHVMVPRTLGTGGPGLTIVSEYLTLWIVGPLILRDTTLQL